MNVAQEQHNLVLNNQVRYAEAEHERLMSAALQEQARKHALETEARDVGMPKPLTLSITLRV